MFEPPTLERIVEDFIDDIAHRLEDVSADAGDGYAAHGLKALLHNTYTKIDSDTRCTLLANEMSLWAREYPEGFRSVLPGKPDRSEYILPAAQMVIGLCAGMYAYSLIAAGNTSYGHLIGLGLSAVYFGIGVYSFRRIKRKRDLIDAIKANEEDMIDAIKKAQKRDLIDAIKTQEKDLIKALRNAIKTLGIKPYERYADDIRDAPVEAVREALLAKKEYAYANLDLVPGIPTL